MTTLPRAARELLESARLGHIVTLSADGAPHVTCVWVGVDGDEIVTGHLSRYQKLRNIERDPRVALSVATGWLGEHGLEEYVVINGHARLTEGGAAELLRRLAYRYMGPDPAFPPPNPPPGYVLRITVDRITGVGPWAGGPGD